MFAKIKSIKDDQDNTTICFESWEVEEKAKSTVSVNFPAGFPIAGYAGVGDTIYFLEVITSRGLVIVLLTKEKHFYCFMDQAHQEEICSLVNSVLPFVEQQWKYIDD